MEQNVASKKSRKRRKTYAELQAENVRLKKLVALMQRKQEHGCYDANCSLCKEEPGDGTWEFSS